MRPVVTPDEMAAIDAAAPEPVSELIERAGRAVAVTARRMLLAAERPASAGRWVLVIAGRGNNGADGRAAALHLERWGMRCRIIDPPPRGGDPGAVPAAPGGARWALVIDAACGTG
ncbi:MAG: NAD(P)H-hydrate epimerase, partial [Acidimicrobiales bacterium]